MAKDSKKIIDEEIALFRKHGADKLLRHELAEKREMGYAKGGVVRGAGAATRGKRFTRAG